MSLGVGGSDLGDGRVMVRGARSVRAGGGPRSGDGDPKHRGARTRPRSGSATEPASDGEAGERRGDGRPWGTLGVLEQRAVSVVRGAGAPGGESLGGACPAGSWGGGPSVEGAAEGGAAPSSGTPTRKGEGTTRGSTSGAARPGTVGAMSHGVGAVDRLLLSVHPLASMTVHGYERRPDSRGATLLSSRAPPLHPAEASALRRVRR